MGSFKKYLLLFAQEHVNFRFPEIKSILSLLDITMRYVEEPTPLQPYWIVEFDSEQDVKALANRSVSLKLCVELWAHCCSRPKLHEHLAGLPVSFFGNHLNSNKTFKVSVQTYCKHISQKEKVSRIQEFEYLPAKGDVNLNNPDTELLYLEYYGTDSGRPPTEPYEVFFGRIVATGYRQNIRHISLKTRKFIGNTSMDPQLSLLMANQAKVKTGDLVLDPFVGSGSLLVAIAQFGGYVMGADIDYLMLHGRRRPTRINQKRRDADESIEANMDQYNLKDKYVDVLVSDFTISVWRDDFIFDSIVTDPPYGIREATEKVGINKNNYSIEQKHLATHIPAKVEYKITEIYRDLLCFAARHLKLGGRLVCWFPVYRNDYSEEGLPRHDCLNLIANSEQLLSKLTSRRLLTYEKVSEPDESVLRPSKDDIADFKDKYFQVREETRRERRLKMAILKEERQLRMIETQSLT